MKNHTITGYNRALFIGTLLGLVVDITFFFATMPTN